MRGEKNQWYQAGDITISSTTSTPQGAVLNNVEAGTTETAHIGQDFTGINCVITLQFALYSTDPTSMAWYRRCRVIVYRRKANPTGTTGIANWDQLLDPIKDVATTGTATTYGSTDADMCGYNRDYVPATFQILHDSLMTIDMNKPTQQKRLIVPFAHQTRKADQTLSADWIYSNQLVLVIIPLDPMVGLSDGAAKVQWHSVFSYYE